VPASGIAVAISAFDSTAGITSRPARKYATTTAGPAIFAASPGSTKMPLPIMAPTLTVRTAYRPRSRSSSMGTAGS
jgi:hypothetical protein